MAAAQAHQLHHHTGRRAFEEVFGYVGSERLILISCNRDHFLALTRRTQDHPGLIILIRRRTRQSECAHLSVLLQRAGEEGLRNNVNFA